MSAAAHHQFYGDIILWERPIQVVAAPFIRPGDTVLDIGANIGALSIAFNRMVGPSGRVIAYEASPRNADWAAADIDLNKAEGVELVRKAVYREDGVALEFFVEESYYGTGSSLYYRDGAGELIQVPAVTVDAEMERRGIRPSFIKVDVEGAEADVITGAERTLREHHPALIIEQQPHEPGGRNAAAMLVDAGYALYNVNTLDVATPEAPARFPRNLLALPINRPGTSLRKSRLNELRFGPSTTKASTPTIRPGGYVIHALLSGPDDGDSMIAIDDQAGRRLGYFHTSNAHIKDSSCAVSPVVLKSATKLTVSVFRGETPSTLRLDGLLIEGFEWS